MTFDSIHTLGLVLWFLVPVICILGILCLILADYLYPCSVCGHNRFSWNLAKRKKLSGNGYTFYEVTCKKCCKNTKKAV